MAIFKKPAIGLDISDHSIEAVFIARRRGRPVVASYGRISLPPGAIVDGYVERRDAAGLAIRKLLSDRMVPPLPKLAKRVVFALPESQIYSHIFQLPDLADEAELSRTLASEADGRFPYPHDELASGYAVIARRRDKKDVYYAAVHKDTLGGYLDLFKAAGLEPAAIEGEAASSARAVMLGGGRDPVMIVDIGGRVSGLSVFDRAGIQSSETLETAGDSLTEALAAGLGIGPAEAESIKREQGLAISDQRGKKALQDRVGRLAGEVMAALAHYEGLSGRQVSKIVLCGGSSMMPGLVAELAEKMRTPGRRIQVEQADPWKGLEVDPTLEEIDVRRRGVPATTAIGLGLRAAGFRGSGDIDFLSGASARRRQAPVGLRIGAATVAVLALATGAWLLAFGRNAPPSAALPPSSVYVEAAAALGPVFDLEAAMLTSGELTTPVRLERDVEREVVLTDGYAKGSIEIVNESGFPQTLVAKTRFLSEGGVLFRLDDRASVPARGRTAAAVTADRPGPSGDIGAGRFTIPGLSAAAQESIYGLTDGPMRGGVESSAPPFTEGEREKLLDDLRGEALARARDGLSGLGGGDLTVLDGTSRLGEPLIEGLPELGQATGPYRLIAVFPASAVTVRTSELMSILEVALSRSLPAGVEAASYALDIVSVEAVKDERGAVVGIRAVAVASRGT